MGILIDDGKIEDNDFVLRRFIVGEKDDNDGESTFIPDLNIYMPTAKAFRYKDDGISSYSKERALDTYSLTLGDIVDTTNMKNSNGEPVEYVFGIAYFSVLALRQNPYNMRFMEDEVPDVFIQERGKSHIIWGTETPPPNAKEWRRLRIKFLEEVKVLLINQPAESLLSNDFSPANHGD